MILKIINVKAYILQIHVHTFVNNVQEFNMAVQSLLLRFIERKQMGFLYTNFRSTAILKFVNPTIRNPTRFWPGWRVWIIVLDFLVMLAKSSKSFSYLVHILLMKHITILVFVQMRAGDKSVNRRERNYAFICS